MISSKHDCAHSGPPAGARLRRPRSGSPAIFWALALLLSAPLWGWVVDRPAEAAASIIVEEIEITGNSRTSREIAVRYLTIAPGDSIEPAALFHLADPLIERGLFQRAQVHTRPGSAPGRIIAVLEVEERGLEFRLGAGYEDLSGWYLIPAQVNLDNRSGHGELLRASLRFGYRVGGLVLETGRPAPGRGGLFWSLRARAEGVDRIYFHDETEVAHRVGRSGVDLRVGRQFDHGIALSTWLSVEGADADSSARVYRQNDSRELAADEEIPWAQLPPEIVADLGLRRLTRWGLGIVIDRRSGSALAERGTRAGLEVEAVASPGGDFARAAFDGRIYAPLASGLEAAARVRVAGVGPAAPFYERLYLGGLYTVRGFPSQSLSPAFGETRLATGSLELRSAWIGPVDRPALVGLAFLDAGLGWDGDPQDERLSVGAGYGVRVRIPWVRYLGLDVGFPLTDSPTEEAFHLNASLGWTF